MTARRIEVFFYGLFMDSEILRAKGIQPINPRQACLPGFALRIGQRATLVPDPEARVYGVLMQLSHDEIERLYAEPSVRVYRPEAVVAELDNTAQIPALCFNLPVPPQPGDRAPDKSPSVGELPSLDVLSLVSGRQGHFRLESGHHSQLWFDLDSLFVEPARIAPLVNALAQALRVYELDTVCGPLVGGAFLAQMLSATVQVEFSFTERVLPAGREGLYRAEYRLPRGLRERVRGKRIAIVDDVISAGSAVRGTYCELQAHGAQPCVVGALLMLGSVASDFFAPEGLPVTSVAQLPYELWMPGECPLCVSGLPIEDTSVTADTSRASSSC